MKRELSVKKKPKYLQLSFGYSKGPSKGSRSNEGGL